MIWTGGMMSEYADFGECLYDDSGGGDSACRSFGDAVPISNSLHSWL